MMNFGWLQPLWDFLNRIFKPKKESSGKIASKWVDNSVNPPRYYFDFTTGGRAEVDRTTWVSHNAGQYYFKFGS